MSDSKFPLCESVGLKVSSFVTDWWGNPSIGNKTFYINASDVERLLSEGVRLYGRQVSDSEVIWRAEADRPDLCAPTKQCLAIAIKPIVSERCATLTETQVREVMRAWIHSEIDREDEIIARLFDKPQSGGE